ncbi:Hypothetical protein MALK_2780 [Metamycoplasma alkalescens 14918]|uniref:Uncharacterized protein n=1 Tax=Metamycoplasma alkalescens 14918 TaxID=1188234 RepID=N9U051_9BACT|nr:hypothetical protein [Metamycoplasma alkalescens]ENY53937.1 Hypothetical protein MALK_2780 [Metamycoplasma alkalescens 14918]
MTEESILKAIAEKINIDILNKDEFEIFDFKKAEEEKTGSIHIKEKKSSKYISGESWTITPFLPPKI